MYGYIYETTNLINGKKYIGQHKGFFDKNYYGSGKIMVKALNKYGKKAFKVSLIEECDTQQILDEREIYWIDYYNADLSHMYYNIAIGGNSIRGFRGKNNPMFGKHHSEQSKLKMSINQSKSSWNKGTKGLYSEEYREKISRGNKGRVKSREECKKISDSLKEYYSNPDNRKLISNKVKEAMKNPDIRKKISNSLKGHTSWNKGKHLSEETKEKLSKANLGKTIDLKTRHKISNSMKQVWNNFSEERKNEISMKLSLRTRGENNPSYAYYKLLYNEKYLYFSGKNSLLQYCLDNFNLPSSIVSTLISTTEPYIPTRYDLKHNRAKASGIIIYKIHKDEYYKMKGSDA